MSSDVQTLAALAVVALAAVYLLRSVVGTRRKGGCSSGACPTDRFKRSLKR